MHLPPTGQKKLLPENGQKSSAPRLLPGAVVADFIAVYFLI
jgi:hypothetical protein